MGVDKNLSGRRNMVQHIPSPILVIVGPLLGLAYVIVFPFTGIFTVILAIISGTMKRVVTR